MITYTIEKLADYIDELKELSKLHYKESCPYEDIPLNVAWEKLFRLENAGVFKLFIMKNSDKLIGYASFIISHSIEYQGSFQASLNNIFIHPEDRGHGGKFITWCDGQLKNYGVQVVYHHVKAKNDYGVLLKRLGYDIMNVVYSKRLDK